jgi:ferredoxin
MAYKITDACINCGTCDSECPSTAISEKENRTEV